MQNCSAWTYAFRSCIQWNGRGGTFACLPRFGIKQYHKPLKARRACRKGTECRRGPIFPCSICRQRRSKRQAKRRCRHRTRSRYLCFGTEMRIGSILNRTARRGIGACRCAGQGGTFGAFGKSIAPRGASQSQGMVHCRRPCGRWK